VGGWRGNRVEGNDPSTPWSRAVHVKVTLGLRANQVARHCRSPSRRPPAPPSRCYKAHSGGDSPGDANISFEPGQADTARRGLCPASERVDNMQWSHGQDRRGPNITAGPPTRLFPRLLSLGHGGRFARKRRG